MGGSYDILMQMGLYSIFIVAIAVFAVASLLALPWIWFHAGHISRKLSKIIELIEGEKPEKNTKV